MVTGQKHLSGRSRDRLRAPALASSVPPVEGNNGFAPVLSASYWKEAVSKLFPLILLVCWSGITTGFGANHSWRGFTQEYGVMIKVFIKAMCASFIEKNTIIPCVLACASSLFRWSWWLLSVFSPLLFSWAVGQKHMGRSRGQDWANEMNEQWGTGAEKEKCHICLGVRNSFKRNKTVSLKIRKFNSRTLKMTEFAFIMYEALAPGSELI